MDNKIMFNSEYLRDLIERDERNKKGIDNRSKNGSINGFAKILKESGYSITAQGVHLWLLGRMPRVEALVSLSKYFDKPLESFIIEK